MGSLLRFLPSAALFIFGIALQVSDYHNPQLAKVLFILAVVLLLGASWPWLRRVKFQWPIYISRNGDQPRGEIFTRVYQLRYANVLGVGAEILSQYGRSPGVNEEAKTISWRGTVKEHEEIHKLIAADDVPPSRKPLQSSDDFYFIGRLDDLLREAVPIQGDLARIGDQVTHPIVDAVWKWSEEAARLMEPRYPGDAIVIRSLPPEEDKYERDLLAGYMTQAAGWLVKCREELRAERD